MLCYELLPTSLLHHPANGVMNAAAFIMKESSTHDHDVVLDGCSRQFSDTFLKLAVL